MGFATNFEGRVVHVARYSMILMLERRRQQQEFQDCALDNWAHVLFRLRYVATSGDVAGNGTVHLIDLSSDPGS